MHATTGDLLDLTETRTKRQQQPGLGDQGEVSALVSGSQTTLGEQKNNDAFIWQDHIKTYYALCRQEQTAPLYQVVPL